MIKIPLEARDLLISSCIFSRFCQLNALFTADYISFTPLSDLTQFDIGGCSNNLQRRQRGVRLIVYTAYEQGGKDVSAIHFTHS